MTEEQISVIISFKVKESEIAKAQKAISEFIASIRKNEPDTLLYKSFQKTDEPKSFIHVMTFKNKTAQEIHRKSEYCQTFVEKLYPLCSELPTPFTYNEIN